MWSPTRGCAIILAFLIVGDVAESRRHHAVRVSCPEDSMRLRAVGRFTLFFLLLVPGAEARAQDELAIANVAIIDATDSTPRAGQTVVIRGNRIAQGGARAPINVPHHARVLDGRGRFLIPGLWDMHVHTATVGGRDLLALY